MKMSYITYNSKPYKPKGPFIIIYVMYLLFTFRFSFENVGGWVKGKYR